MLGVRAMLPRLRMNLDFAPSPVEDKPGLLIRDPLQYSDATLIIPPALVECLEFFDGEHSALDLRAHLVRLTGDLNSGDIETHLSGALSEAGFVEDASFEQRRAGCEGTFAAAGVRAPAHAGSGYPEESSELHDTL